MAGTSANSGKSRCPFAQSCYATVPPQRIRIPGARFFLVQKGIRAGARNKLPACAPARIWSGWELVGESRCRRVTACAGLAVYSGVRVRTHGTDTVRVRHGFKGQGAGSVLAVKRPGLNGSLRAALGILRIIEPQPDVVGVGRRQVYIGVESKGFVGQNGLDADVSIIAVLRGDNVTVVPGKAEAVEFGIFLAVGTEEAALVAEDAEGEIGLDAVHVQNKGVGLLAVDHRALHAGLFIVVGAQAVDELRYDGEPERGDIAILIVVVSRLRLRHCSAGQREGGARQEESSPDAGCLVG